MIYLFFGENSFEVEQRVKALVAGFDGDVEKFDSEELAPENLPDLLAGVTLFSTKRLVIIKNASQNKALWAAFGEWFEKGVENDVVLVESSLDKRTKTYKWLEKNAKVQGSQELKAFEAVKWLQATFGAELDRVVAEFLVEYVGTDQWRLEHEVEKLKLSGKKPTRELIEAIVEPTPQATAFELLDAAFQGRAEDLERIYEVVSRQEEAQKFFGLIASQVYALAVAVHMSGKPSSQVTKETGLHPFVLQKTTSLARQMSKKQLQELVERLTELDANLKSRGVDAWVQIRSFLNSLAQ